MLADLIILFAFCCFCDRLFVGHVLKHHVRFSFCSNASIFILSCMWIAVFGTSSSSEEEDSLLEVDDDDETAMLY
jgi:hypothetical protein